ncbi:chemotaxis protein MotB [Silvibacterium bohemicum]|uniref:Chemotaxis protein MotB n=1 Tax=Silvibacterium bohemicum TaxID=1577686 RepID=A0A841JMA0_9BACT|nr:flagellar motor protein MotB [Silvibacterium bohemicum]MBB6142250.1 chemotaxis protein MotB [Silvibacterium bohemicum]
MSRKNIIIIKKVKAHGGHHGGAWKVAYADFVTAMMSLFIVLWLLNTSEHVRKAVAGYFNDPLGYSKMNGTEKAGQDSNSTVSGENIQQLKDRLQQALMKAKDFQTLSKQIEMTITPEGLRIELLESKNGTFFDSGSANLNDSGREILTMLARQLRAVPNRLSIEGHTDSQPYSNSSTYGNWELSADRANAARRIMQDTGLRSDQVSQVRGYADQRLRLTQSPLDPSNRRISLIVQYVEGQPLRNPISVNLGKEEKTQTIVAPPPVKSAAPAPLVPSVPSSETKPPAEKAAVIATKSTPASQETLAKRLLSKFHHN